MTNQENTSVTDLLALRLESVPFHDINQNNLNQTTTNNIINHETNLRIRWVPQVTSISFVGTLEPITSAFFKSNVPLFTESSSSHRRQSIPLSLVLLPNTVVVGQLPNHHSDTSSDWLSNWLISGELCVMSGEFTIVAQSLYRLEETNHTQITAASQLSFTGFVSSIVPANHVTWVYSSVKTTTCSLEEALQVADEPDAWHSAEICSQVHVSLADLEWLDVSIELGEKCPEDPSGWIQGGRELVSLKCRPSKTKEDHTRFIEHASTIPLVGQLIAIDSSEDSHMKTFFIQL